MRSDIYRRIVEDAQCRTHSGRGVAARPPHHRQQPGTHAAPCHDPGRGRGPDREPDPSRLPDITPENSQLELSERGRQVQAPSSRQAASNSNASLPTSTHQKPKKQRHPQPPRNLTARRHPKRRDPGAGDEQISALSRCSAAPPRCRRSSAAAAAARPRRRRGSGAAVRPGSRSSDRRTGCAGRSSAARRLAVEQPLGLDDLEHRGTVSACSSAIVSEQPSARRVDEREVLARDLDARLRERHLEVLHERAEERPLLGRGAAARPARPTTNAVPQPNHAGSRAAVLRPREDPRDRAQRREVVLVLRAGAPAASRS